jgi:probable rRNA maturation factor
MPALKAHLRVVSISRRHRHLRFRGAAVVKLFHFLDQNAPWTLPPGELSIVFLNNRAIGRIHADFLDDPTPTDVITFPGDPSMDLAGEICVSADQAMVYAQEHNQTFARELTLYLVHGWLHLAGLNDHTADECKVMRSAEAHLMSLLEEAHLIPAFVLR